MKFFTTINFTLTLLIAAFSLTACNGDKTESSKTTAKIETQAPAKLNLTSAQKAETQASKSPNAVKIETVAQTVKTPEQLGLKVFNKCKSCHTTNKGGRNGVGPNLYGVVGRSAGTIDDFKYSPVMSNSDVIWTEENLAVYLTKPRAFMPKTRMAFIGLKKETDRDNIIAYLKSNSDKVAK